MSPHQYTTLALAFLALPSFMSCASWKRFAYEGWGRDSWQKPDEVIRALELSAGDKVADLGSGGGYFTFRLARAVGPQGIVYAVDVDQSMLDYVAEQARKKGLDNIQTVKAADNDARIPGGGVDLIFTSNTYHHLPDHAAYFEGLKQYLRPGGRIAIIETKDEGFFAHLFGHVTEATVIRDELTAAGYRLEHSYDFLPRQSFQIFVVS